MLWICFLGRNIIILEFRLIIYFIVLLKRKKIVQMSKHKKTPTESVQANNYLSKTLESLEKNIWKTPSDESYLMTTCHNLRKKIVKDFTIEDLIPNKD